MADVAGGATTAPSGSGGASGAADSGGSEGADDTSVDTGSDGGDGSGEGDAGGDGSKQTAAEKRYQLKWFGRDQDWSEKELLQRFDPDFEHEFHDEFGLPMKEAGKPLKANWQRIARALQKEGGAAEQARRHGEMMKKHEDRRAWAQKQPENLRAYMREDMGIKDYDKFMLQEAARAHDKRKRMVELSQKDPIAYAQAVKDEYAAEQRELQESTSRFEEQRQQQQQREHQRAQWFEQTGSELRKLNVPLNTHTSELAERIVKHFRDNSAPITFAELAQRVQEQYHKDIFGYLDKHDDESLLKVVGDKRRERLRRAEIAALKVQRKAAPAEPKPRTQPRNEPEGMTAEEFMRRGRRG